MIYFASLAWITTIGRMFAKWFKDQPATRFPLLLGLGLYLTAFGLQLAFLPALFWDDWFTNFLNTGNETRHYWDEVGFLPIYGFIQSEILQNSPVAFRLLQLAIYFLGGILFASILRSLRLPQWFVTTAFLVFLVAPINSARVSISMLNYAISLFLFLAGWALIATVRSRVAILLALPVFFVSFSTLTILPMFLLPAVHVAYRERLRGDSFRVVFAKFTAIICLPVLYWFVWRRVDPPKGEDLVAYFTPSLSGVIRAGLLVGVGGSVLGLTILKQRELGSERLRFVALSLGIFTICLGASGYVASGRLVDISEWMLNFVPEASEWSSRHQLLLGIGVALTFAALTGQPHSKFRKVVLITSLCAMVLLNATFMQTYLLDYRKQKEVVSAMAEHPEILNWQRIYVNDGAMIFNARGRTYRKYEIQGMLKKAFSIESEKAQRIEVTTILDCATASPDGMVSISSTTGRLKALLTLSTGVSLEVKENPCTSQ